MIQNKNYQQCFKLLLESKELYQGSSDNTWVWIFLNKLYGKIPCKLFARNLKYKQTTLAKLENYV